MNSDKQLAVRIELATERTSYWKGGGLIRSGKPTCTCSDCTILYMAEKLEQLTAILNRMKEGS